MPTSLSISEQNVSIQILNLHCLDIGCCLDLLKEPMIALTTPCNPCNSYVIEETDLQSFENYPTVQDVASDIPNFEVSPERLSGVVESNDVISSLTESGGIHELIKALETDPEAGILGDGRDLYRRHRTFGSNQIMDDNQPCATTKGFCQLILELFKDTTIILLLCCATLSLMIGIKRNGPQEGFRDGSIIFLAIFMVVNFSAICGLFKARILMSKKKSSMRAKRIVGVSRNGKIVQIPVSEVVVGDILRLKSGDTVPADGLFIPGESFKVDNDVLGSSHGEFEHENHPSLFSGEKVVRDCSMLVTSVGRNTEKNRLMRSVSFDHDKTSKFQRGIDRITSRLEIIGLSLSLLVLVVQVMRCYIWESECQEDHDPDPKGVKGTVEEIMNEATKIAKRQDVKVNGLVTVLCALIFSTRDGLPLGMLIYLAGVSKRMRCLNGAKVLKLPACATIGLVTTICTSLTGDSMLYPWDSPELWIGLNRASNVSDVITPEVVYILCEGICLNMSDSASDLEKAISCWAQRVLGIDMKEFSNSRTVLYREAYDVEKNQVSLLSLRRTEEQPEGGLKHIHWKGDPKIILPLCSHYYDQEGAIQILDEQERGALYQVIENIASESDSLQCFALAYKQQPDVIGDQEERDSQGLTLLGLVGLKKTFKAIRESGVDVKLVVNVDVNAARNMAVNSGIFVLGEDMQGAVIDASEFRNSSQVERMNMIPGIRVIANATPFDKLQIVQCLRQIGNVVAFTGICSRDSAVLKQADAGVSMGDYYADEVVENGDIHFLDIKLESVHALLKLGRCVCKNLQKLMQLHLTLNIVAFVVNFVVVISTSEVPLTTYQVLWAILVVDVVGALALAVSVVNKTTLRQNQMENLPKVHCASPIITTTMWRNIAFQSLFQVTVLLILNMKGSEIMHVEKKVLEAMIFNCYALCQMFLLIKLMYGDRNVSEGILLDNPWLFLVMVMIFLILQVAVIEITPFVTHAKRLDLKEWGICIGIAAASVPIGWLASWIQFPTQSIINLICVYIDHLV